MYKDEIRDLIARSPLGIDTDIVITGRPPTMASSEFLINKEQGDWAEKLVLKAINEHSTDYFACEYGRSENLAAGDEGFAAFYSEYQDELNTIGKRPDILIFRTVDFPDRTVDIEDDEQVGQAVAAIEIRSSSFLANKYSAYMQTRQQLALEKCDALRTCLMGDEFGDLLKRKNETIYKLISEATCETFREVDFRCPSWSLTEPLRKLTSHLKELKETIRQLHKRDYLSITPKMEDIALVNRWIQKFNVKHFYLQVFFDKAYVISFKDILALVSDENNEGNLFFIERDEKNQRKTTIKINVQIGKEIIGRIDMPEHRSAMKELDRGRLLFYVTFQGGRGYLDRDIFIRDVIHA